MVGTLEIVMDPQPESHGAEGIQSDGQPAGVQWWDWGGKMWGEDVGEPELDTACPYARVGDRIELRGEVAEVADVHFDRVGAAWCWIIELEGADA